VNVERLERERLAPAERLRTTAAVGFTLLVWSSAFVGIRVGLGAYSPGEVALLRYLVASVILGVYCGVTRTRLPRLGDWAQVAFAGAVGFTVYNLALNSGERSVTAAAASFVGNTVPVVSAVLAMVLLRERLSAAGWLGILVSFSGTGLIAVGEGKGLRLEAGVLWVLLAATAQSAYFVLQKPLLTRYRPLELTTLAIWAGTAFLLPFLPGLLAAVPRAPLAPTLAVVYLGAFPAAIGYVTWAYVLARLPVAQAASFLYGVPGLTTLIGWVWLGELPSLLSFGGGALALVGVLIVNVTVIRGRRRPP
jgi:drug/metabolite transporter (DMT)-like permease